MPIWLNGTFVVIFCHTFLFSDENQSIEVFQANEVVVFEISFFNA